MKPADKTAVTEMIQHPQNVNYPLGAASYIFEETFVDYLSETLSSNRVKIGIGAQPNSSPHFGTLLVASLAFALAEQLEQQETDLTVEIVFEAVDTAPSNIEYIDDIKYQTSLRHRGIADEHMDDFLTMFEDLSDSANIEYSVRRQRAFNQQKGMGEVISTIIENQDTIVDIIDPEHHNLRIRVACPDCGITDKNGVQTTISGQTIESVCPRHGHYETNVRQETAQLEYNTPLRNLVRGLLYSTDGSEHSETAEWLRVTGRDYAGYYQEQMLYRCASQIGYPTHVLPTIVYAPLVIDWSGAKLSKTLYVDEGAYTYLPSYLINFREFYTTLGKDGIQMLYDEVSRWLNEPYRLFRNYSVYYFMEMFENV
jgi:hypothetical protein